MCGILAVICNQDVLPGYIWSSTSELLGKRGPDSNKGMKFCLPCDLFLHMHSWVLHLRGLHTVPQPFINSVGDVLQWNGDIFGGIMVEDNESDTVVLSEKLAGCKTDADICNVFAVLQGPWSFVFFCKTSNKLWFGRDYFGRRSLLWQYSSGNLALSSVAKKNRDVNAEDMEWLEVPAQGLYCISFDRVKGICINLFPWKSIMQNLLGGNEHAKADDNILLKMFHGEIHEKVVSPIKPFISLSKTIPSTGDKHRSDMDTIVEICTEKKLWGVIDSFIETLGIAVKKRVQKVPKKFPDSSPVGILFSGGIDCTILALLADKYVPKSESIDLLNVAFETMRSSADTTQKYNVPDRLTGKSSFAELTKICPQRKWNFVEVNVTLEELRSKRESTIADLAFPLRSVLDDSIGCALWFAANGEGNNIESAFYKCQSKVLLCGMGADEQLGGYSRHRSAFENHGWRGLDEEIRMEIERISVRNLGRDNRIIADHGRDARLPYLDENVVSFLNELPLQCKVDLTFKRGLGEKLLLRGAAYKLGLHNAAVLPKRAIQFGSRIAKAECRKEKGSDHCYRLSSPTD